MAVVLSSSFAADEAKPTVKTSPIDASRLGPELVGAAKLLQSGFDQQVVITYITNSAGRRSHHCGRVDLLAVTLSG